MAKKRPAKQPEQEKKTKHLTVLILLATVVLLLYGNTLNNGFIHDDHGQIEQNQYIQSWKYLPKVISGCIWEAALGGCKELTSYYRPLQSLSYLITYTISPNPSVFHAINLLYFLMVVFLVYLLAWTLTENLMLSVTGAILFAALPINTETVNWIATVPELLYAAFLLLATIFYIKYRRNGPKKFLIFVFIFYALGLLSKEPAFLLPVVLAAFDWLYMREGWRDFFRWELFRLYGILAAIFGAYLILRVIVLGSVESGFFYTFTLKDRIVGFFELFYDYIAKLFWPHPLSLFYYPFTVSKSLLAPKFLVSLATVLALVILFAVFVRYCKNFLAFSLSWLFVFLIPPTIFLNALGENVFSERYVFVSSIGFGFVIAYALTWLAQKNKYWKIAVIIAVMPLSVLLLKTIWDRNKLWHDDDLLYKHTLEQNPQADLIRYNLAVNQRDRGDTESAMENFKIIAEHGNWRDVYKAYNNLSEIYRKKGDQDKSLQYLQLSIKAKPDNENAYNNLGAFNLEQNKGLEALKYFCKALAINPNSKEAGANFSRLAETIGSAEDMQFISLYYELTQSGSFSASATQSIVFEKKLRLPSDHLCRYSFSVKLPGKEIILPFLIMGNVTEREIIKIKNSGFDQEKNLITLDIDEKFQDMPVNFLFPTCDGIYYTASTN